MTKDKIIIGAGLYGLYSALFCARQGDQIIVLEKDPKPFMRATFVNQARVHMGYHYPRSLSTGIKSAGYYRRFHEDFGFCIHKNFRQIYATSSQFSWTNAEEFRKFCHDAGIFCEDVNENYYFREGMCDGAFLTEEDTYDAQVLKQFFLEKLADFSNVELRYQVSIEKMERIKDHYRICLKDGSVLETGFVLNATYASINQIQRMLGLEQFGIKYELCEIILCKVNDRLRDVGITVMDGPFFSIMPFGKTGLHSLTSVTFTPHMTCYDELPAFPCQRKSGEYCTEYSLGNCNECVAKPESAWRYMSGLARKYLREEFRFEYVKSLFSMKPILKTAEIDDSRPTVIRTFSKSPTFISVLSGKINTVYDLDEVLKNSVSP